MSVLARIPIYPSDSHPVHLDQPARMSAGKILGLVEKPLDGARPILSNGEISFAVSERTVSQRSETMVRQISEPLDPPGLEVGTHFPENDALSTLPSPLEKFESSEPIISLQAQRPASPHEEVKRAVRVQWPFLEFAAASTELPETANQQAANLWQDHGWLHEFAALNRFHPEFPEAVSSESVSGLPYRAPGTKPLHISGRSPIPVHRRQVRRRCGRCGSTLLGTWCPRCGLEFCAACGTIMDNGVCTNESCSGHTRELCTRCGNEVCVCDSSGEAAND